MSDIEHKIRVEEASKPIPEAQAWEMLNVAVATFTKFGFSEHQILHSAHAEKLKEGQRMMLSQLVGGITDPCIKSFASALHMISEAYGEFYTDVLNNAQAAIQSIPLSKLVSDMQRHDPSKPMAGVNMEAVNAQLEKLGAVEGFDVNTAVLGKPCEQILTLFSVAAAMLGGYDKLAEAQAEIMGNLPPEYRNDLRVALSAQACGCLSLALTTRMRSKEFVTAQITGIGEGWNIMNRAAMLGFLPMWDSNAKDSWGQVLDNSDEMVAARLASVCGDDGDEPASEVDAFVDQAAEMNLKPQKDERPLEADPHPDMKATSTMFSGTRTIN